VVEDLTVAGMVTVYDTEGNAIRLDHVDARDYLATGRYTMEPMTPEEAAAKAEADQAVREAAAAVMTAENDAAAIREAHPLDHDGDGKKGGSLPKAARGGKGG
jgi:hypothetical protein